MQEGEDLPYLYYVQEGEDLHYLYYVQEGEDLQIVDVHTSSIIHVPETRCMTPHRIHP